MLEGNHDYNEKLFKYAKVSVNEIGFANVVVNGELKFEQSLRPYLLGPCTDDRFMGEVETMKGLNI